MANIANYTYQAKEYNLSGLQGISDQTLEMHFKLYQGYVTHTNTLNEQIAAAKAGTPGYAEMSRRLGFEYNVMVQHE